jgi:hypothetical protein
MTRIAGDVHALRTAAAGHILWDAPAAERGGRTTYGPPGMTATRATIVIDKRAIDYVAVVEAWFAAWGAQLAFQSENYGCGCCVDAWDVEGPPAAIAAIPEAVRADSEWVRDRTT